MLYWLAGGLTLLLVVSWVASRILRAVLGPSWEPKKSAGHQLGEAEQLQRNQRI
ncbi:MAG: hypothetical protein M9890_09140 [Thermomicrobiales bacterium]|nr:hypothetical protein [Thermomicrobiales bacterium]